MEYGNPIASLLLERSSGAKPYTSERLINVQKEIQQTGKSKMRDGLGRAGSSPKGVSTTNLPGVGTKPPPAGAIPAFSETYSPADDRFVASQHASAQPAAVQPAAVKPAAAQPAAAWPADARPPMSYRPPVYPASHQHKPLPVIGAAPGPYTATSQSTTFTDGSFHTTSQPLLSSHSYAETRPVSSRISGGSTTMTQGTRLINMQPASSSAFAGARVAESTARVAESTARVAESGVRMAEPRASMTELDVKMGAPRVSFQQATTLPNGATMLTTGGGPTQFMLSPLAGGRDKMAQPGEAANPKTGHFDGCRCCKCRGNCKSWMLD